MEIYTHTKHCTQMFTKVILKWPRAGSGPDVLPQMDAKHTAIAYPLQKANTWQLEKAPTDPCTQWDSPSENQGEWKPAIPNADSRWSHLYNILKWQHFRNGKQIGRWQESGRVRVEDSREVAKLQHLNLCKHQTLLYLHCSGRYMNLYMINMHRAKCTHTYTQTTVNKTEELNMIGEWSEWYEWY